MRLRDKLVLINVLGIVIAALAIFICAYLISTRTMEATLMASLKEKMGNVQRKVEAEKKRYEGISYLVASRPDLIAATKAKNIPLLQSICKDIWEKTGVNMLTLSDMSGAVLARGHSTQTGDSVLNQSIVQSCMKGIPSSGIEEGSRVKYTIRAGHPVMDQGQVIGTVTSGMNLSEDRFVDEIKKEQGVECTIFQGDTRVSTTIIVNGNRAMGTKMTNQKVLDTVLTAGGMFEAEIELLGGKYFTVYWPIRDPQGKITGMFFLGVDMIAIRQSTRNMLWSVFIVGSIICLLIAGFVSWYVNSKMKKISEMVSIMDSLTKGDLENALRQISQS